MKTYTPYYELELDYELAPKKCFFCGGTALEHVVTDSDCGVTLQKDVVCQSKICRGQIIASFAFGSWEYFLPDGYSVYPDPDVADVVESESDFMIV